MNDLRSYEVNRNVATIRELRADFRSVKRKIEQHGEVTITDRGKPAYVITALHQSPKVKGSHCDYYARLLKRQPTALSFEETGAFWEAERRKDSDYLDVNTGPRLPPHPHHPAE